MQIHHRSLLQQSRQEKMHQSFWPTSLVGVKAPVLSFLHFLSIVFTSQRSPLKLGQFQELGILCPSLYSSERTSWHWLFLPYMSFGKTVNDLHTVLRGVIVKGYPFLDIIQKNILRHRMLKSTSYCIKEDLHLNSTFIHTDLGESLNSMPLAPATTYGHCTDTSTGIAQIQVWADM